MSLGCSGLIDSIVLFKDNAFLGTSAHESVPPAGYLLATCWLPVGYSRFPVVCRDQKATRQTLAGSSEMALGRAGANLGRQNGAIWAKNV